ncbi:MAG: undecaprenyldiphospho-muramoylpentapeptide beta-N-acetylglucosaminyltransferase [Spirochaeta sp. LUC14_002_19_P3]|nr:MAG: undecaprenyldiphospho-muramoylpentapeptide beta-N-acetylglucosaminyltransferase [Spirochaeta sp. LUC14_002_19_P3]
MSNKIIAFTGGGTAGHVFPAFPVISRLQKNGYEVFWIGSAGGMEKQLTEQAGIRYYGISAGKLRRYWSWQNVLDIFRIIVGVIQSFFLLKRLKPTLLFSKGGFVSVPPVAAARLLGIKSFTHESDADPGLATRINMKLGAYPLVAYERTLNHLPDAYRIKGRAVGNPIRDEIFKGDREKGREIAGLSLDNEKPLLLVLGGSLGARKINDLIFNTLDNLLPLLAVVHQTGSGNPGQPDRPGYLCRPFFNQELPHLLAAADIVVSRSGAGAVWELAAVAVPTIFIPLKTASRGDQIKNAQIAAEIGFSITLDEDADSSALLGSIKQIILDESASAQMKASAGKLPAREAANRIADVLEQANSCSRSE